MVSDPLPDLAQHNPSTTSYPTPDHLSTHPHSTPPSILTEKGSFAPISGVVCPHLISSNVLLILSSMASMANTSILFNMFQYQYIRLMSLISRAANVGSKIVCNMIQYRADSTDSPGLKSARRKMRNTFSIFQYERGRYVEGRSRAVAIFFNTCSIY